MVQAMSEVLAFAQGKTVPGAVVHHVDVGAVDVKRIREKLKLTQTQMAALLGTSPSGYKKVGTGPAPALRCRAHLASGDGERACGSYPGVVGGLGLVVQLRTNIRFLVENVDHIQMRV